MYKKSYGGFAPRRHNFSGGGGQRRQFGRRIRVIDPSLFVRKATLSSQEEAFTPVHNFTDFKISPTLLANIQTKGFISPTPIQDQAIPALLEGRDVVGIADTGTGKTAAFLVPLINKVYQNKSQKVLIVAPTRELAVQIKKELEEFSRGMGIFAALCIGGVGIGNQIYSLQRNPNFVIGTPGRLKDLEERRRLNFQSFATVVLDEVDRMLDMGFLPDVSYILSRLSQNRHSLFFSATVPEKVKMVMQKFLKNPVTISVKSAVTAHNVDQDIIRPNGKPKIEVLHQLLITKGFDKVLIFGRTKWSMDKLAMELRNRGFKVAAIHGNKSQGQRQRSLDDFRQNKVQILLATDLASRGLDIDNVTHVINFDPPESYEDYVHRIGRTGRAGKKGTAITFVA